MEEVVNVVPALYIFSGVYGVSIWQFLNTTSQFLIGLAVQKRLNYLIFFRYISHCAFLCSNCSAFGPYNISNKNKIICFATVQILLADVGYMARGLTCQYVEKAKTTYHFYIFYTQDLKIVHSIIVITCQPPYTDQFCKTKSINAA